MAYYKAQIQAGYLEVHTEKEEIPLLEALGFGSRENPKRVFSFVSRVLGKYTPVRPRDMRNVYDMLADTIGYYAEGPIVAIGMAEVATGLGNGVQDCLIRNFGRDDVMYLHTTRHIFDHPVAFAFEESHSHAPEQVLHMPLAKYRHEFLNAKTLVLVDDEITTGKTISRLAAGYLRLNPGVREIIYATIVDWMSPQLFAEAQDIVGREVKVESIIDGTFHFQQNPNYRPVLPHGTQNGRRNIPGRRDLGRLGIKKVNIGLKEVLEVLGSQGTERFLVLGTGEFTFIPFLLAEKLEQMGYDVLFQSTGRSPLKVGDGIKNKIAFPDHHGEGVPNYLYNLPKNRRVIVVYESEEMAVRHSLPDTLGADAFAVSGKEPLRLVSVGVPEYVYGGVCDESYVVH